MSQSSANELTVSAVKYRHIKVLLQDQASQNERQTCHIYEMEEVMKKGSNKRGKKQIGKAAQVGSYFPRHSESQQAVSGETPDCRVSYKSSFLNHKSNSPGPSGEN